MNFILWITIIILCIAVTNDIRFRRIPNWLTFPAMSAGITYHVCTAGIDGLVLSIAGLLVGFSVFFIFHLKGGMGAGDIKLMAAIGSLFGPKDILYAALFTAIAGGIYAIAVILVRHNKQAVLRYKIMAKNLLFTGQLTHVEADTERLAPLRYAVAIAAGALTVLAQRNMTHWM
ncbi:MAG: A24 family peptidase [Syntrophorhabdaceae bacterium]